MKLEVPHFDGSDPLSWIFNITQFFEYHSMSLDHCVLLHGRPCAGMVSVDDMEFWVVVKESWLEVSFAMASSIRSILNLERVESAMMETQ